jgi:hypothetical protein
VTEVSSIQMKTIKGVCDEGLGIFAGEEEKPHLQGRLPITLIVETMEGHANKFMKATYYSKNMGRAQGLEIPSASVIFPSDLP